MNAAEDILLAKPRAMFCHDLARREAGCEKVEDTVDGNSGPFDNWSAKTDSWVDRYVLEVGFHWSPLCSR
jgi:hypothetical protein